MGDEIELLGIHVSCPSDRHSLPFSIIVEELQSVRLDRTD
jgi:hypothetical protein